MQVLILLDVMKPGMDGYEVCLQLALSGRASLP
jgi:CheY-like chemotaxis protein